MSNDNIQEQIAKMVSDEKVLLFMKGTPEAPMCGFSKLVVDILQDMKVQFSAVNVLEDMDIREGIKVFSSWPTIPQLYVSGEFIGGCDIIRDMNRDGSLFNICEPYTVN